MTWLGATKVNVNPLMDAAKGPPPKKNTLVTKPAHEVTHRPLSSSFLWFVFRIL